MLLFGFHHGHKRWPQINKTYTNYSRAHSRNAIECSAFTQMTDTPPILLFFQSIKRLMCLLVLLQLICFMAPFNAFPFQTSSGCSWDSLRSLGNELSQAQAVSGRLGQVSTMTRLRATQAMRGSRLVK